MCFIKGELIPVNGFRSYDYELKLTYMCMHGDGILLIKIKHAIMHKITILPFKQITVPNSRMFSGCHCQM